MSTDLSTRQFQAKVNGQDATIKIKTDLTWGETQELLSQSVRVLDNGQKDFLFNNFFGSRFNFCFAKLEMFQNWHKLRTFG